MSYAPPVKECQKCHVLKDLTAFSFKNKTRGERQSYCRPCKGENQRAYYRENKKQYIAQVLISRKRRQIATMVKIRELLEAGGCTDCEESDFRCLQFDHVRGKKVGPVSVLVSNGASWSRVEAEIAKCEVRCANCHWKVTAERAGWYAYMAPSSIG